MNHTYRVNLILIHPFTIKTQQKYFFKHLKQQKNLNFKIFNSWYSKMTNFEEKQFLEHDEYVPKIKIELEKLTGGDLDKLEQCEDLANAFATYDRKVLCI